MESRMVSARLFQGSWANTLKEVPLSVPILTSRLLNWVIVLCSRFDEASNQSKVPDAFEQLDWDFKRCS